MAPRNRDDNFMDVDSDSDISLPGDVEHRGKGKGKGKATDKRKKDKGRAKAKEVSKASFCHRAMFIFLQQAYTWEASYTRSWDTVQEDEAGSLQGAVEDLMARGRRRRSIHSMFLSVVWLTL
jgi:transcription initiation factor TFIIH subunit 2